MVPSLDSCCYGVEDDGKIERPWKLETIRELVANGETIGFLELFDLLECCWRLRKESTLDEKRLYVFEPILSGEGANIVEELGFGDAD